MIIVPSHPFAKKKAKEWATQILANTRIKNALTTLH